MKEQEYKFDEKFGRSGWRGGIPAPRSIKPRQLAGRLRPQETEGSRSDRTCHHNVFSLRLKHISFESQRGVTLVSVLLAVAILSILSVALAQILAGGEKIADVGRETTVATAIAREGLELVRVKRDSNWFSAEPDVAWLSGGICEDEATSYFDTQRQFTLDVSMVLSSGVGDVENDELYIHPHGAWLHEPAIDSEELPYTRVISIDCSTKEDDFVEVTSTVRWQSRAKDREVVIKEKLFNWFEEAGG